MLRTALTLLLALAPAAAVANPPSPDPKSLAIPAEELSKARELVRKLGSETFFEREEAENELAAMGRLARPALIDGANTDPDPEVRSRCGGLLSKATAGEMKARLDTFLADTDGRYEHDLPGWTKLRATVRGEWELFGWTAAARPKADKAARELFLEFLKAPGGRPLLAAISAGDRGLGPMVTALKTELYYARFPRGGGMSRTPALMEVAVVLFADSIANARAGVRNSLFSSVLATSGIAQAVQGTDDKAAALRAVLDAWIDSRTEPYEMYAAMNMANNSQNPDAAVRLAVRLMTAPGATGTHRGQALATLARHQPKDRLPAIERLIGDDTVVTTITTNAGGKVTRQTVTLGDLALATAVQITGQKLEDYHVEDRYKGSGPASVSYIRYHIPEERRKEAAARYGWWRLKESLRAGK